MPEDFSGTSVVHGGGPYCQDCVVSIKSAVIEKSLVLFHSGVKGSIIILCPSTKGMKKENGVLVAKFQKLFSGVFKEEDVTVVKRVSDLEGINSISILLLDLFINLGRGHSVMVKAIIEFDLVEESHLRSTHKEVSLSHDSLYLTVLD